MSDKKLFFRKLGQGKALIILHGLFGASDNWLTIGKSLSEHFEVYLVDQRNHGQSFHDPEHNFDVMAEDLGNFIKENNIAQPIILGHSMGGKVAMNYALSHPGKLEKLIIVDISPRGYKVHHDQILEGLKSIDLGSLESRKEADDQLAKYVPNVGERQFLLKSLSRAGDGFEWKINVAAIDNNIGLIVGEIDGEPNTVPTLFIDGENSNYIRDIDLPIIKKLFPDSQVVTIKNAGHWVHAEQPEAFLKTLMAFLS
ncbi:MULTISPECIES: alpha/beta fold hydrolase [unclassified Imperialibacter]|uniref:alpha/beta fold hydrolase n=1 Tax=unclassified Imperialibacter TaxID=2629706 RepID=UPI0012560DFD|nr:MULTISPECIES: alpha/beta fold hydrolase [unclassified Imperialibacter]CAD5289353.1 Pimeloyl-ACP methyl ester carboxylesterase [Imperialibacter sp. 89]CAD5289579.1 Pimeloyl-ACP methyl ester carboxylesterase [Imperialibacter sp. 75]VVT34593.1 Pimeloyl-ACP methyl ester carboxylesterase [Imperialibacter sp. EC-SDR9]